MLNFSPDHLDRHGTLDAYLEAKLRIFAAQTERRRRGLRRRRAGAGRRRRPRLARRARYGIAAARGDCELRFATGRSGTPRR